MVQKIYFGGDKSIWGIYIDKILFVHIDNIFYVFTHTEEYVDPTKHQFYYGARDEMFIKFHSTNFQKNIKMYIMDKKYPPIGINDFKKLIKFYYYFYIFYHNFKKLTNNVDKLCSNKTLKNYDLKYKQFDDYILKIVLSYFKKQLQEKNRKFDLIDGLKKEIIKYFDEYLKEYNKNIKGCKIIVPGEIEIEEQLKPLDISNYSVNILTAIEDIKININSQFK